MQNKKILFVFIFVISIAVAAISTFIFSDKRLSDMFNANSEKLLFIAGRNDVIVIDAKTKKEIASINLSAKEEDISIELSPHDIQTTPNQQYVWVTASASQDKLSALHKNAKEHMHLMMTSDQAIIIDPNTNSIKKRLQMGNNIRLSDIVITSDSKYAYVSAEKGNALYRIDASNYKIELIQLPPETRPHEIALSEDGTKLYTRSSIKNEIFVISTKTNKVLTSISPTDVSKEIINWSRH